MKPFPRNRFVLLRGPCLLLLICPLVLCSHGQSNGGANMNERVGEINVKVISVMQIQDFKGGAIRAHFDPRFVVALLLEKSKQDYAIPGTDITLPSNQVAFFAIHSVAQTFMASDVLGKNYRMRVKMEIIAGARHYHLERI